jgi:hypothetical protein
MGVEAWSFWSKYNIFKQEVLSWEGECHRHVANWMSLSCPLWNHPWWLFVCVLCSTDPPYISKAKNTGVSVGQKGILSCEASAVPMADFQWFKEETRYLRGIRVVLRQIWWVIPHVGMCDKGQETDKADQKCGIAPFVTEFPLVPEAKKNRGSWDMDKINWTCLRICN